MTPARAVEVATMFEDTVLSVRHLTEPRSNPTKGTLRRPRLGGALPLFIAAGALLLGAVVAFAVSVHEVAVLRRAHDAAFAAGWVHAPFVLPSGGRWLDFAVAGALGLGTWALIAALGRLFASRRSPDFTVGPSPRADISAPLAADQGLVIATDGGWSLELTAPMSCELTHDGGAPSLLHVPASVPIVEGTRALVDLGTLRFIISATATPPRVPTTVHVDWLQESYIGAVGLAAGLFLAFLYLIPPDPKTLAIDTIHSDLVAHYIIKAPELPEVPLPPEKGATGSRGGKAAAGPAGAIGNHQARMNEHARLKVKGNAVDPHVGQQIAHDVAAQTGVLGAMAMLEKSHIGSIFPGESALGADAEDAIGGIRANATGNNEWGEGGADLFGRDVGGGGHGVNTIGLDPNGLRGIGPGGTGPGGWGPPSHSVALRPHVTHAPVQGDPIIRSKETLSKDIIKRVVHAHRNEIKFCYEKRLSAKMLGTGRVVARFIIAGNGRVISAGVESTTLNDTEVESCIADAVHRWEFPRPEAGGVVVVSYPFMLTSPN
jgi:hypothetical protein